MATAKKKNGNSDSGKDMYACGGLEPDRTLDKTLNKMRKSIQNAEKAPAKAKETAKKSGK